MTVTAMSFIVFVVYCAEASLARDRVSTPAVLIRLKRSFAGAFVLRGFERALAER